jgi:hypothetical protein
MGAEIVRLPVLETLMDVSAPNIKPLDTDTIWFPAPDCVMVGAVPPMVRDFPEPPLVLVMVYARDVLNWSEFKEVATPI